MIILYALSNVETGTSGCSVNEVSTKRVQICGLQLSSFGCFECEILLLIVNIMSNHTNSPRRINDFDGADSSEAENEKEVDTNRGSDEGNTTNFTG